MSELDDLRKRVEVLESILRRVVTQHGGQPNPLAMLGHNVGPDGQALDPTKPRWNLQLEYEFVDPKGERWIEMNLDYFRPSVARRWMMFKALREEHDKYASWTFNIAGDGFTGRSVGRFAVCGKSDVDTTGPLYTWVNGRGDTYVSGGLYWATDENSPPYPIGKMDDDGTFHIGDSLHPLILHNAKLRR